MPLCSASATIDFRLSKFRQSQGEVRALDTKPTPKPIPIIKNSTVILIPPLMYCFFTMVAEVNELQ